MSAAIKRLAWFMALAFSWSWGYWLLALGLLDRRGHPAAHSQT